jgi:hypothetical protein
MKMYRVALAICAGIVLAAGSASAAVLYSNDFSSCDWDANWSTVWRNPPDIFQTRSMDHTGNGGCAVQLHYDANRPDALTRGEGAETDRDIPGGGKHMNVRYWIYLSPGFQTSNISTKWAYGLRSNNSQNLAGPGCLLVTQSSPAPFFGCAGAFYPDGYYNVGWSRSGGYATTPQQQTGVWACYEYEAYLGSAQGSSDGYLRLWKNDQIIAEAYNLPLWVNGSGDLNNMAFYQERGIGDIWYDDLVITDGTRIGCSGGAPAGSTTKDMPPGPPQTPSITTVNSAP